MLRTRLVTGAAVATLLLLMGCSTPADDDGAAVEAATPTPTATAPTQPSPAISQTSKPEPEPDFKRTDEVGAQAAARYAVDVILYTVRSGDEAILNRLEWPGTCHYCTAARSVMREWHAEADIIEGSPAAVDIIKTYAFDEVGGGYPLDIRISEPAARLLKADHTLVRTDPAAVGEYRIELRHDGETWRLINILGREDAQREGTPERRWERP